MSTVAFVNLAMHGHVNPTLPVVAELVRRGHSVSYHTAPAFAGSVEAAGASVRLYSGGDRPMPDPPIPLTMLGALARTTADVLPGLRSDLREIGPDLVVHGAACPWGAVAARELGVPAAALFTTFAFDRRTPSPTRASWDLLASAVARPAAALGYLRSRWGLRHLPPVDLANVREPLNLVFTSRAFQPRADAFDRSYRFVGASLGARPPDPEFASDRLRDPVLYASLGTVFDGGPRLLRAFATALAPLGGTVVVATGATDPAALGPLPGNVLARRFVPQPEVLARAALFVTHGGMNSVNEAMYAGVPMLVVPQGADQPLVARRVAELGAGLAIRTQDATEAAVRALARRLLGEPRFRAAAATLRVAQRAAGGHRRAADELEHHLRRGSADPCRLSSS
uniref:macrolide family glycosyltransferase n=1 Tax=Herbidospora sakaeratensis TaxID=564415 RepID=UPI0007819D57|nr:macrolide family glycosyltransferase [Herbidospora sakaeratensis]